MELYFIPVIIILIIIASIWIHQATMKMKSDDSELIVPKTILITKQQNSAEQIIPLASKQNEVAETDR